MEKSKSDKKSLEKKWESEFSEEENIEKIQKRRRKDNLRKELEEYSD